jgi:hypothetical protein
MNPSLSRIGEVVKPGTFGIYTARWSVTLAV